MTKGEATFLIVGGFALLFLVGLPAWLNWLKKMEK